MSKGNSRRVARDHKYADIVISRPKEMTGLHGWRREVFPEIKPTRHGKPPEKPEPEDRWQ